MAGLVHTDTIECDPSTRGHQELTQALRRIVSESGIWSGLCSAFIRHTSASLIVCENADREVLADLERFMGRLVKDGDGLFRHRAEGEDDMPAHIRSVLTHTDITLPVRSGALELGTWQGIFLWEHRTQAHRRTVSVTVIGTDADA